MRGETSFFSIVIITSFVSNVILSFVFIIFQSFFPETLLIGNGLLYCRVAWLKYKLLINSVFFFNVEKLGIFDIF